MSGVKITSGHPAWEVLNVTCRTGLVSIDPIAQYCMGEKNPRSFTNKADGFT